jgi:hypothetical protein
MDFKRIAFGLFLWVSISLGIAIACKFFDFPFIPTFFIALLVQYFIGDSIYRVITVKELAKTREAEAKIAAELSKQFATVECPCDEKSNQLVALNLNEENLYKCNKCDKSLKCMIGWKTFQTTTPLTENPFNNFDFTKNKEYDI